MTVQRSDASRRSFTTVNDTAGVEDETDTGGAAKPPRRGTADSNPASSNGRAKSLSEDYVMVAESQDMISQTSSVPAGSVRKLLVRDCSCSGRVSVIGRCMERTV